MTCLTRAATRDHDNNIIAHGSVAATEPSKIKARTNYFSILLLNYWDISIYSELHSELSNENLFGYKFPVVFAKITN